MNLFTINPGGDRVCFSKGNLQATYDGSAWSWAFAANPWDCVGDAAANTCIDGKGTVRGRGTVDLFGWSAQASCYGVDNSGNGEAYLGDFVDWGDKVGVGWRTLSKDEWYYLFHSRVTASGVRYAKATVNGRAGYILLPDDWRTGYYTLASTDEVYAEFANNSIDAASWACSLESHGAVFLPAAGRRNENAVAHVGTCGRYWSSTRHESEPTAAYCVGFEECKLGVGNTSFRFNGYSVRLVKDAV